MILSELLSKFISLMYHLKKRNFFLILLISALFFQISSFFQPLRNNQYTYFGLHLVPNFIDGLSPWLYFQSRFLDCSCKPFVSIWNLLPVLFVFRSVYLPQELGLIITPIQWLFKNRLQGWLFFLKLLLFSVISGTIYVPSQILSFLVHALDFFSMQ